MADAALIESADVTARLAATVERIVRAARDAGRAPDDVTLVAISKAQPDDRIAAAIAAGVRVFGENRVQEAQQHWQARRDTIADLELHLVGHLQTNKVADAVALFDVIETVDRPKLAARLADAFAASGRALRCFVQVNTGEEAQKAGVWPADTDAFIAQCRDDFELPIAGLMCIPPLAAVPAPHFALLGEIAVRNGLAALSMGMSADFETAIGLGATHVRVGSAVFGPRPQR